MILKFIADSKVIFKSIIDPDDNCWVRQPSSLGLRKVSSRVTSGQSGSTWRHQHSWSSEMSAAAIGQRSPVASINNPPDSSPTAERTILSSQIC